MMEVINCEIEKEIWIFKIKPSVRNTDVLAKRLFTEADVEFIVKERIKQFVHDVGVDLLAMKGIE